MRTESYTVMLKMMQTDTATITQQGLHLLSVHFKTAEKSKTKLFSFAISSRFR